MLDLPIKAICRTVKNECFIASPHFGHCLDGIIDEKHVGQTIKLQQRLLVNTHLYLHNKHYNHYKLLSDQDFVKILTSMISADHYLRPNVAEIISSDFVTTWSGSKVARAKPQQAKLDKSQSM